MTKPPLPSAADRYARNLAAHGSPARRWLEARYDELLPVLRPPRYGRWIAVANAASWDGVIAKPEAFRKAWREIQKRWAADGAVLEKRRNELTQQTRAAWAQAIVPASPTSERLERMARRDGGVPPKPLREE